MAGPPVIPVQVDGWTKANPDDPRENNAWKSHRPFPPGYVPAAKPAIEQAMDGMEAISAAVAELVAAPLTAPAPAPAVVVGRKDDTGKIDMSLLFDMPHALESVAEVLQWAITKKLPVPYTRGSWQGVSPFQQRYTAAQWRHEISAAKARLSGSPAHFARDAETGLLELAHIATDAMFRLENAVRQLKGLAPQEP